MRFTPLNTAGWFSHPERGGAFAEAAIITPCLLVILFVCIQFMFISFRALSLQWITTEVMRDLALSRCNKDEQGCILYTTGSERQIWRTRDPALRLRYARQRAETLAAPLGIHLAAGGSNGSAYNVCISELQTPPGAAPATSFPCSNPGSPGSLIQVESTYDMPLFFTKVAFVTIPPLRLRGQAIAAVESFPQMN